MASAAGGSAAGGGDRRSSQAKVKTPVGPHVRSIKPGAFERECSIILKKNMKNELQWARNLLLILRKC